MDKEVSSSIGRRSEDGSGSVRIYLEDAAASAGGEEPYILSMPASIRALVEGEVSGGTGSNKWDDEGGDCGEVCLFLLLRLCGL